MFNIKEVDVSSLREMLDNEGESIHLIDVRTPAEVSAGAIPGAQHIPLHMLPMALNDIPEDPKVVIYCRTGARSAQACAFLSAQGKDNVFNLSGGIVAWVQGGLAVA